MTIEQQQIEKIRSTLNRDKILAKAIIGLEPLKLEACANVYHELVKNIVYQQISYKAADSIYAKFIALLGSESYLPQQILNYTIDDLRPAGLSKQKANYIINISEYFVDNQLFDCNWKNYSDQEIKEILCQIKGVGNWTAKMILIFQLERQDIFPFEDLAIQYVIKDLYNLSEEKSQLIKRMEEIAELWRPYRTVASLYLWSYRRYQISGGK